MVAYLFFKTIILIYDPLYELPTVILKFNVNHLIWILLPILYPSYIPYLIKSKSNLNPEQFHLL